MLGERLRAGHAQQTPIGDKILNTVREAVREAWELGQQQNAERTEAAEPPSPTPEREPEEPDQGR